MRSDFSGQTPLLPLCFSLWSESSQPGVVCIVKLYCFEIFGGILAKCIELRSSNIGKWMLGHGYAPPTKKDFSEFDFEQFLMSFLDFFASSRSPRLRVSA